MCSLCGGKPTRNITAHVKLPTHLANVDFEERHLAKQSSSSADLGWPQDDYVGLFDQPDDRDETESITMDVDAERVLQDLSDSEVSVTGSEMFGSLFDSACESEDEKVPVDIESLLEEALDVDFLESHTQENHDDWDSAHQGAFAADLAPSEADDWYPFKNKEVSAP